MADTKVSALTAASVFVGADLMYGVRDVAGTPVSRKITVTNLFGSIDAHCKMSADDTYDIGASGALRPKSIYVATSVDIGDSPAQSGALRLANNEWIRARNSDNSADHDVMKMNANDELALRGVLKLSDSTVIVTDAVNFEFNTNNGTKFGTATTQKIGFWNKTPAIQPTNIVDADGTLADLTTKFNSLLTKLETIGLIAAS